MTTLAFGDELAALRSVVFGAIAGWNASRPQRLCSHEEHGSINVTLAYADEIGLPTFSITVHCALAGTEHLTFHGHDLGAVAEQARLTVEHRIAAELQRRCEKEQEDALERNFGIPV